MTDDDLTIRAIEILRQFNEMLPKLLTRMNRMSIIINRLMVENNKFIVNISSLPMPDGTRKAVIDDLKTLLDIYYDFGDCIKCFGEDYQEMEVIFRDRP